MIYDAQRQYITSCMGEASPRGLNELHDGDKGRDDDVGGDNTEDVGAGDVDRLTSRFFCMLHAADQPLYEKCENFSIVN